MSLASPRMPRQVEHELRQARDGIEGTVTLATDNSSKVLVLGASGFLGAHVTKALVADGRDVRIFTRPTSNTALTDHLPIERHRGDVRDAASIVEAVKGCNTVYYCVVDTRAWLKDTSPLRSTNIDGLRNAMDAAIEAGVERFVYTSTYMTLGTNPSGICSEADAFNWWDDAPEYVRVRVEAENLFLSYCEQGLPGVACNVVMTYGADDLQPTAHGWIVQAYAKGEILCVWDVNLSSVGIEDAARAMILAEQRGRIGERYLIADRTVHLSEMARIARKAVGRSAWLPNIPMPLMYVACWLQETQAWLRGKETYVTVKSLDMMRMVKDFDTSKARDELGWEPRPVEESLAEGARWFAENT